MYINIIINGQYCNIEQAPKRLIEGIDKTLQYEVKGSKHIKGDWDGVVHLFNHEYNSFNIGHLDEVKEIIRLYAKSINERIDLKIIDKRQIFEKIKMSDKLIGKQLLPYQEKAVEAFLDKKIGNVQSPTGSGKTLIASEVIRRLGLKTLFVVNRKVLLHQSKKELENLLGTEIGIIGDNKLDIKHINVATIQSLMRVGNQIKDFLTKVNVVVFDESHFLASDSYQTLGRMLPNSVYRLGLSATVRRDDNKDLSISAVSGDIIFDIDVWEVEKEDIIIRPKCFFIKNENMEYIYNWRKSYNKNIVNNFERNKKISEICKLFNDKKILILVNRIKHGEILNGLINNSMLVNGELCGKSRDSILDSFATITDNILIGTSSIFNTGYNNPRIDIIINAGANVGFNSTIQGVGRVMRVCKEKNKINAIYIDFLDSGGIHHAHSWARYNALRSKSYIMKIVDDIHTQTYIL